MKPYKAVECVWAGTCPAALSTTVRTECVPSWESQRVALVLWLRWQWGESEWELMEWDKSCSSVVTGPSGWAQRGCSGPAAPRWFAQSCWCVFGEVDRCTLLRLSEVSRMEVKPGGDSEAVERSGRQQEGEIGGKQGRGSAEESTQGPVCGCSQEQWGCEGCVMSAEVCHTQTWLCFLF